MQNQSKGQNMKSRNQDPNPQTEPQTTQMPNKKKNQGQEKTERT
ncbi:hypothetical protein [Intestinimonas massiliensis (ex Afouda et al. 2020)]|nr:hypothetical protein [Intestinimonas massiliensis (ex Afouda et al. 2020)]